MRLVLEISLDVVKIELLSETVYYIEALVFVSTFLILPRLETSMKLLGTERDNLINLHYTQDVKAEQLSHSFNH